MPDIALGIKFDESTARKVLNFLLTTTRLSRQAKTELLQAFAPVAPRAVAEVAGRIVAPARGMAQQAIGVIPQVGQRLPRETRRLVEGFRRLRDTVRSSRGTFQEIRTTGGGLVGLFKEIVLMGAVIMGLVTKLKGVGGIIALIGVIFALFFSVLQKGWKEVRQFRERVAELSLVAGTYLVGRFRVLEAEAIKWGMEVRDFVEGLGEGVRVMGRQFLESPLLRNTLLVSIKAGFSGITTSFLQSLTQMGFGRKDMEKVMGKVIVANEQVFKKFGVARLPELLGAIESTIEDTFERTMGVRLTGAFMNALTPVMQKYGGVRVIKPFLDTIERLINPQGKTGLPAMIPYLVGIKAFQERQLNLLQMNYILSLSIGRLLEEFPEETGNMLKGILDLAKVGNMSAEKLVEIRGALWELKHIKTGLGDIVHSILTGDETLNTTLDNIIKQVGKDSALQMLSDKQTRETFKSYVMNLASLLAGIFHIDSEKLPQVVDAVTLMLSQNEEDQKKGREELKKLVEKPDPTKILDDLRRVFINTAPHIISGAQATWRNLEIGERSYKAGVAMQNAIYDILTKLYGSLMVVGAAMLQAILLLITIWSNILGRLFGGGFEDFKKSFLPILWETSRGIWDLGFKLLGVERKIELPHFEEWVDKGFNLVGGVVKVIGDKIVNGIIGMKDAVVKRIGEVSKEVINVVKGTPTEKRSEGEQNKELIKALNESTAEITNAIKQSNKNNPHNKPPVIQSRVNVQITSQFQVPKAVVKVKQ